MSTSATPGRTLFITIPVADVARSKEFFTKLGFEFNPAFSGPGAECMVVNDQASFMLGSHEAFAQQSHLPMADARTHALALYSFSVPNREDVDAVSAAALAAGGTEADGAEDHGFMYTRSFFDLDGHGWNIMWVNPAALEQGADAAQEAGASA